MKNYNFTAYQGSTKSVTMSIIENGEPKNIEKENVVAKIKRSKDDTEALCEFAVNKKTNIITLILEGEKTAKINLLGDSEVLNYDVFVGQRCLMYGTIRMIKAVSV